MILESIADGARWAVLMAFALSAIEKATTIWTRSSAWHPVMMPSPWRRRHAMPLMLAALILDCAVSLTLVFRPTIGGFAALVTLGTYTLVARTLHRDKSESGQTCRCFWRLLDATTSRGLVFRNAALALCAVGAVVSQPSQSSVWSVVWAAAILTSLVALTRQWADKLSPVGA